MTQRVLGPTGGRRRRRLVTLSAIVGALALVVSIPSAVAVHDLGLFELDRNAQDPNGPPAPDDWATLYDNGANTGGASSDFTGVLADVAAPGTQFQGGGSKDDLDITQWLWKEGEPLDKDDITNAYAAAYTNTLDSGGNNIGDLIIYYGLDRFSSAGSAQVGFWFLQDPNFGLSQTPSGGGFQFTGAHVDNDVLVQVNFSGGGVIDTFTVYKWLGGSLVQVANASDCLGPPAVADDPACGVVNRAPSPSPWPYVPKANEGSPGTFLTGGFFEGGINISRLIPAAGCFNEFLAETRSSTPFDARLKDLVTGDLDTCVRDVRVLKTPDDGQANSGDTISFGINVKNIGNVQAENVTLTDNLPNSSLNWSIASQPAGNPCSISGAVGSQVLSCNFGTLAVNAERDVTISSPTTSASCGAKPNTVTVSATGDIDADNNRDDGQITVNCPDVSVVKTPDDGQANAGDAISFSITVTNNGPGSASNVTLSDNLPDSGLDWSESSDPANACTVSGAVGSQVLSCDFGTLAQGATRIVSVSSPTDSADCGPKPNRVTVSATGDINASNNSDDGQITVNCPDVSVVKTPDDGQANAGDAISFSITVTNNGPGSASNVTLSDNLPDSGLDWSIASQPADNPCSISGAVGSEVLSCNFGTLAQGESRSVSVTSATDSADCGAKPNTVTISATGDINPANNTDDGRITINCPDVSVVKTPDGEAGPPGTIPAGSNATFSITVTNNGPGSASNVTLSDNLPNSGLDWSESSDPANACAISGAVGSQVLSCDFGTLAQGESRSVSVTAATTAANCGTIPNTVTISATGDVNPANNTDPGSIVVECGAIRILKNSTKGPRVSTAGAVFSITGPGISGSLSVTDDTDAAAPDEDADVGEVCVSGLQPGGNYMVNETSPPNGYGGASEKDVVVVGVAGDCSTAGLNAATFSNPPLADIQVNFRDGGSGETSATIECVRGLTVLAPDSTTPPAGWDSSQTHEDLEPDTYICTVVIDP